MSVPTRALPGSVEATCLRALPQVRQRRQGEPRRAPLETRRHSNDKLKPQVAARDMPLLPLLPRRQLLLEGKRRHRRAGPPKLPESEAAG